MHTATKMHVTTPANLTGPGFLSRSLKIRTKRKISHAKADVAQPEWTPPRCWRIEVQPRRNHRGVHCDFSKHEKRQSDAQGPLYTLSQITYWLVNIEVDRTAHCGRGSLRQDCLRQMRLYTSWGTATCPRSQGLGRQYLAR